MLVTFRNYYTASITWFLEYISVTASAKRFSNQKQTDFQIDQKSRPNFVTGQKVSLALFSVGGRGILPSLLVFPQWLRSDKSRNCHFATFSDISLETFDPNLVSLTLSLCADIGQNSDGVISNFRTLVNPLENKIVITPKPMMIFTWNMDK